MGSNEPQRDLGIQLIVVCNGDNNEARPGQGGNLSFLSGALMILGCDEKCCYHLLWSFQGRLVWVFLSYKSEDPLASSASSLLSAQASESGPLI